MPINQEYVANFFRNAHIVGVKRPVLSHVLGHKVDQEHVKKIMGSDYESYEGGNVPISPVFLFDLEKVNTDKAVERRREVIAKKFGSVAHRLQRLTEIEHGVDSPLINLLSENLYAKPKDIIKAAKQVEGYAAIFEADAGNWEKFTLGEHTETVLGVFDENYADQLPANLLPVMRLALLTHDIGKPEARRNKGDQQAYNVKEAYNFMQKINVDESLQKVIAGVIGKGQELTTRGFINGDLGARQELLQYCQDLLAEYDGAGNSGPTDARGLAEMCLILQTCDSAAYTDMAVTRSEKSRVTYRNAPAFNRSFHPASNLTKRDVKLKI